MKKIHGVLKYPLRCLFIIPTIIMILMAGFTQMVFGRKLWGFRWCMLLVGKICLLEEDFYE